jgi:hypothetical protein
VYTIDGGPFSDAATPIVTRVSIAASMLTPRGAAPLAAGQFEITAPNHLTFMLPSTAVTGEQLPVRVIVEGSESPPAWVQVP